MQFSVDQSALDEVVSSVLRAVPKKPTRPILGNILLEVDILNQQLNLTGFDLGLAITGSCKADVSAGGKITFPAVLFSQIISKLDGHLYFDLQGAKAKITCGKSGYDIAAMPADEYPLPPLITGEDAVRVNLNPEIIAQGLKRTLFATSIDETKQILTGIHVQLEPEFIQFISTDGHRSAVYKTERNQEKDSLEIAGYQNTCQLTIRNSGCAEMIRLLSKCKQEAVSLAFDNSNLHLTVGDSSVICRKLEGQYPRVLSLFPKSFLTTISFDYKDFLSALRRISIVADQKNYIVKCELERSSNEIILKVDTEGSAGFEVISAEFLDIPPEQENTEEEPKTPEFINLFAFNSKYILAGLGVIDSEIAKLKLNTALGPMLLEDESGAMQNLIMPVQIRS